MMHDWIEYYALHATPKNRTGKKAALYALYIDTDGAKHGHGPETSENACYKCDCDFLEWETLLGEAAGREA